MRILFLLTTVRSKVHAHHATGFLSAALKQVGHETDYIELPRIDLNLLREKIETYQPHVLAVSAVMQQMPYVKTSINYAKSVFPNLKIILGGTHPILKPDCMDDINGLDVLCTGEGERPLIDFVQALRDDSDLLNVPNLRVRIDHQTIHDTPRTYAVTEEDLAYYPMQDRDVFPYLRETAYGEKLPFHLRVLWGRGCPYACAYCAVPSLRKELKSAYRSSGAKWVRYPPVERCIEEIEYLSDRWNIDTYVIDDDVLTTRKDWVMKLAEKYPSTLKDKVQFECNLRIESIDRESMAALKDMGCKLLKFGLENGNADIRQKILKRPIPDEEIIKIFSWAKEIGIPTHTFNMVGVPDETKDTIRQTIELNRKIQPAAVQITVFFPYSGVPLGEEARKKGLLVKERESYFDGASVQLENLTMPTVEFYARWFKFLVYKTYDRNLAWTAFKSGLRGELRNIKHGMVFLILTFLKKFLAPMAYTKICKYLESINKNVTLQVETMGADGVAPEAQAQYDIEDMMQDQVATRYPMPSAMNERTVQQPPVGITQNFLNIDTLKNTKK